MRFQSSALFSVVFSAALLIPTIAPAQPGLREGVKIRVSVPGSPETTGVIQSVTADSLVVFAEPNGAKIGIARAGIRSLEVSQGKSTSAGALKGGLWGAAVFGASGLIVSITTPKDDPLYDDGYGGKTSRAALIGQSFAVGALIGAGVGAFIKSEKWETVAMQPSVSLTSKEVRVAFRVRLNHLSD